MEADARSPTHEPMTRNPADASRDDRSVPPPVGHVLEAALYVEDLSRSRAFYEGVLGMGVLVDSDRLVAVDAGGATVLLLFLRGACGPEADLDLPPHDGAGRTHVALAVSAADLEAWRAHLEAARVPVEHEKTWSRGGRSLYFRDPDGHLVELASPGVWPTY